MNCTHCDTVFNARTGYVFCQDCGEAFGALCRTWWRCAWRWVCRH